MNTFILFTIVILITILWMKIQAIKREREEISDYSQLFSDIRPAEPKKNDAPLRLPELMSMKGLKPLNQGFVPVGITANGELLQSSWQKMTTGIITGRRNHGKSSILKSMIFIALHAKRQGLNCKIILFDPHHNLPDATGTFFKPILSEFDETYLGMEVMERGKHLKLFRDLKKYVQDFQTEGFDESAPWHFIFIDETDLLFKGKYGRETYQLIIWLINLRKGRLFFMMSFADTTRAGSGNIGTAIIAAGSTAFVVNYDIIRARLILQNSEDARKAVGLPVGQAVVKVPDAKAQIIRVPYVNEDDIQDWRRLYPD